MRLLLLSAGAAQMYCGSCMRDNALASELLALGHDVTLLPFYTPTLTDEDNVSRKERVFFGGLSVYLAQHVSAFRHTPRWLDRLIDAPGLITAMTRRSIAVDPKALGALTVSTLKGEEGHQAKEIEKLVEFVAEEPPPDLVNIPYTLLITLAAPLKRTLRCPVVVTLQGEDLFLDGLVEPYRTQAIELIRRRIDDVDLFVAVSRYYAEFMQRYLGIPAEKIRVAPLGIAVKDVPAPAPLQRTPWTVGYFARIAPEKGLHLLVEAYCELRQQRGVPEARLRAAGYLPPEHRSYFEQIERRLEEAGLRAEFEYAGAPDRLGKFAFLRTLDAFSVPSPYLEPKGLYALEAMACGVPIVAPAHGAFPEVIERTGGGLLAASEAPSDIAAQLLALWRDPQRSAELGERGRAAVLAQFTSRQMAEAVLRIYEEVLGHLAAGRGTDLYRPSNPVGRTDLYGSPNGQRH